MRTTTSAFVGFLLLCACLTSPAADPFATWTLRNPLPTPNPLRDITHANGLWVAVGDSGTIVTSDDDGQTWYSQNSGITNTSVTLSGVVQTNGLFVAVSSLGQAATSPNGTNWTLQSLGASNSAWNVVTHGNGRFVAGGVSSSNVAFSADGTNWTVRPSAFNGSILDIVYAQGLFVGVGGRPGFLDGFVVTSPDGSNWTTRLTNFYSVLSGVTYGNGKFVGVGNTGTVLSPDGVNWTLVTNASAPARIGVAYGNGVFTSVGATAPFYVTGAAYTSTNGSNWTFVSLFGSAETVRFANGRFAAVGAPTPAIPALEANVFFSDTGSAWTKKLPVAFDLDLSVVDMQAVAYGNGVFASFPGFGAQAIAFGPGYFVVGLTNSATLSSIGISNDGTNISSVVSGSFFGPIHGMIYTNGQFISVTANGTVYASPNGSNSYATLPTGLTNALYGIAYGAGAYVAVGLSGVAARSTDLTNWTSQTLTPNHLRGVVFAAGQFVAVGDAGRIFTSPNGTTWTSRTSGTTSALRSVGHAFGRYIVVGDAGLVLTSTDGITWVKASSAVDLGLRAVASSPTRVMAVGNQGARQVSRDGVAWRRMNSGFFSESRNIWDVVHDGAQFIGSTDGGFVRSPGGLSWVTTQAGGPYYGLIATNGLIIGVGYSAVLSPNHSAITVSADNGQSWVESTLGTFGWLNSVAYGNGVYVAVGNAPSFGSNAPIFTSTTGTNWTFRTSGTNGVDLQNVAFGNGTFVVSIAGNTDVLTSPDGITWTRRVTGIPGNFEAMNFHNGQFVAARTQVATSSDGITWTDKGASGAFLYDVQYAAGTYVGVGSGGVIQTSTNLTAWTRRATGTLQEINAAYFGNDTMLAVGRGGTVWQTDFLTNTPVAIVASPTNLTVIAGLTATLRVTATGRFPLKYQWFKNGVLIDGATGALLTFAAAATGDAGNYHVVVSNDTSTQTSATATLTVLTVTVAIQPNPLYAFTNTMATFTAVATGSTPTAYQWRNNSVLIPGATNATLTFTNAQLSNSLGFYHVNVTFPLGQVSSDGAYFAVLSSLNEVNLYIDPTYQAIPIGDTASITSLVYGPTPLSYQWFKDNVPLAGVTNATLTFPNAQLTNSANYSYTVTYSLGTVTNLSPSTLLVYSNPPPILSSGPFLDPFFQLMFTGLTNRSYEILYATNLTLPINWQTYDFLYLTTNPLVYTINVLILPPSDQHYFRVKILPP